MQTIQEHLADHGIIRANLTAQEYEDFINECIKEARTEGFDEGYEEGHTQGVYETEPYDETN